MRRRGPGSAASRDVKGSKSCLRRGRWKDSRLGGTNLWRQQHQTIQKVGRRAERRLHTNVDMRRQSYRNLVDSWQLRGQTLAYALGGEGRSDATGRAGPPSPLSYVAAQWHVAQTN